MKKMFIALLLGGASAGVSMGTEASYDAAPVEDAEETVNAFDGLYLGLGIGGSFLQDKGDALALGKHYALSKANVNRFTGNVFVGYNKTFKQKFLLGLEALCDFTKNKRKRLTDGVSGAGTPDDAEVKHSGVTPELALRLGYVYCNSLFFAKIAMVMPRAKVFDAEDNGRYMGKINKVALGLGLGVERAFCKKWSARLEGEYVFNQKKTFWDGANNAKFKVNKGWNVRAGLAYHIAF